MIEVEAVLLRAGEPDAEGIVYPVEELRKIADGRNLIWDAARQALIYRGPGIRGCDLPKPVVRNL